MRMGDTIRRQQPEIHLKLLKMCNRQNIDCNLKYEDFERMMGHDSFKRFNGAIRQVRNG